MIQITNSLFAVEVPKDAHKIIIDNSLQYLIYDIPNYKNWCNDNILEDYNKTLKFIQNHNPDKDWKRGGMKLPEGNHKIIGLIKLPDFEMDFEVDESWVEKHPNLFYRYYNLSYPDIVGGWTENWRCLSKEKSFISLVKKKIEEKELTGNLLLITKIKQHD